MTITNLTLNIIQMRVSIQPPKEEKLKNYFNQPAPQISARRSTHALQLTALKSQRERTSKLDPITERSRNTQFTRQSVQGQFNTVQGPQNRQSKIQIRRGTISTSRNSEKFDESRFKSQDNGKVSASSTSSSSDDSLLNGDIDIEDLLKPMKQTKLGGRKPRDDEYDCFDSPEAKRITYRENLKLQVKRKAIKEYQRIEEMFPVEHLINKKPRRGVKVLDFQQIQKDVLIREELRQKAKESQFLIPKMAVIEESNRNHQLSMSSYFHKGKFTLEGIRTPQGEISSSSSEQSAPQIHMENQQDSMISDLTESPYKKLSEKELLFRVLDIHKDAMNDKKKRQAYQHKQGFLRGVLNDQALVWEMRNVASKASNYASVALIKQVHQGNEAYQSKEDRQKEQEAFTQRQLIPTASGNHFFVKSGNNLSRNRSLPQFTQQHLDVREKLMNRCESARRDLKGEMRQFSRHESQLKSFFTYQVKQEQKLNEQKVKVDEAVHFAEIMSNGQPALRKRLYERAMVEFQDEQLIQKKDQQIERYLNVDLAKQLSTRQPTIIKISQYQKRQ
ncbi:hypothetical protein FGO68_gene17360 [Halteria grandinella]|uniref:Uncharacterized protein n=1 Tax=Halteria grandinella TaxID=5974 RepID=A0A8J8NQX6_HALGN|nr:hypothetical protein FGO68_gene17360 [Halteria grandinella]